MHLHAVFFSDANPNLLSAQANTTQASTLNTPATGDLIPGASPRKKPRKQQHVISTEESEMVETNSTDEEKAPGRPISVRSERRESPPREYVGACCSAVVSAGCPHHHRLLSS